MPKCCVCKEEKSIDFFYKCKSKREGVQSRCKKCFSEYSREYRKKNKEKIKEKNHEYYLKNKTFRINFGREWRLKNKEVIREKRKIYKSLNKEKIRKQSKIYENKNKEKLKRIGKLKQEFYTNSAVDSYIRGLLIATGFKKDSISTQLIGLKRAHLLLKREIKKQNEQKN